MRKHIFIALRLFTIHCLSITLTAQPSLRFDHFGWEEGLSQNTVTSLLQDQQGYIWIGTQDGLNRYDGYRFRVFKHDPDDTLSLGENNIFTLLEDSQGRIWVGTFGGLSVLDPDTGQFTNYRHDDNDEGSISDNIIKSIYEDRDGDIWVGTSGGAINRLDTATGRFERYVHDPEDNKSLPEGWVWSMREDSYGVFWVATSSTLAKLDRNSGEFQYYNHDPQNPRSITEGAYRILFEDHNGVLWIGSNNGLNRYDRSTDSFTRYAHNPQDANSISNNEIHDIKEGADGALWIGTLDGLNRFDGRHFTAYHNDPEDPYSLSNDYIEALLTDRSGDMWVGTLEGLNRQDRYSGRFGHVRPSNWYPGASNIVFPILEDMRGNLWVGTMEGLLYKARTSGQTRYFKSRSDIPHGLRSSFIWDVAQDKSGKMWIAVGNGGISCFDPSLDRWVPCIDDLSELDPLHTRDVYTIAIDNNDDIWFGTEIGLFGFNTNTGQFRDMNFSPPALGARERSVLVIHADREGRLWLGGFKGLHRFDPQGGEIVSYYHDPKDTTSLSHNTIYSIYEDKAGALWIGTGGGGLNHLDRATGSFRHFREKNGLPSDVINAILEDDKGYLWLSTNHGLSRFDPNSRQFRNWDALSGSQANEFNFGAGYLSPHSGQLYFGGVDGLNVFHPDSIRANSFVPPVVITNIRYFNTNTTAWTVATTLSFNNAEALSLEHQDDILELEVAALNYQKSAQNQYAYWLQGFHDNWIHIDHDRKIIFTDLQPGDYTLRIKAANNDGVWNEEGTSLRISVSPPWYWAWWSKTLYLLLGLSALYWFYYWRTQEDKRKIAEQEKELAREQQLNARLQQVDHLKDQFLANTSHELRTPLQGIIGISESLIERVEQADQREDLSMIVSSGRRLNSLVNDILDFSKLKNFDIELLRKPINLHMLTKIVLRNNAPLAKGKSLKLINEIPPDLPAVLADENRLQQILYNLIGNAIKFTEKGHIKIGSSVKTPNLGVSSVDASLTPKVTIYVEDTGPGIAKDKQAIIFEEFQQGDGSVSRDFAGTGLGLSISKRLAELHGGEMWVESEKGEGATFFFTLPTSTEKATTLMADLVAPEALHPVAAPTLPDLSAAVPAGPNGAFRILIVDDEPVNQRVFSNYLADEKFHLTQAMNGKEALQAIREDPDIDLVLLDVMMPRMSGYEVCRQLREKYLPSELPIIMITAKNQLQDIVQGLSLGANDYLAKPFQKEELLARIKTQLDLHNIFSVAGRFVPNEFLHSLNRERITEVALGDHIEREVTVLFTDIRDYTTLSETMTPEQNFKFVNAFFGRMGPVIQEHRGFINQYLGDALMAVFPEGPEDALMAAVEMQKKLRIYNEERKTEGRKVIQMGVGLHTGSLILGIIGDKNRMDAATIADTVNTASRIESLTKYYGASILLSKDSMEKLQHHDAFHFRYLGQVLVKGKKEPVDIYECFNGDDPSVMEQKLHTAADFHNGMEAFFNKQFSVSVASLSKVLASNPEDQIAQLFLNKAIRLLHEGAPEGWTGVEVMTFK